MRTALTIDDDVWAAVQELAEAQGKTMGEVISTLVRTALTTRPECGPTRNGILLLESRGSGEIVTSALVRQLDLETSDAGSREPRSTHCTLT